MEEKTTARLEKMQALADTILEKIRIRVEQTEAAELNPQSLKHLTGVMKDLKDIQLCRSPEDAQAHAAITVRLARELEDYCE